MFVAGHPGGCAFGAFCWVRFFWSLAVSFVVSFLIRLFRDLEPEDASSGL
jgi:hypothetical protein